MDDTIISIVCTDPSADAVLLEDSLYWKAAFSLFLSLVLFLLFLSYSTFINIFR